MCSVYAFNSNFGCDITTEYHSAIHPILINRDILFFPVPALMCGGVRIQNIYDY